MAARMFGRGRRRRTDDGVESVDECHWFRFIRVGGGVREGQGGVKADVCLRVLSFFHDSFPFVSKSV